VFCQNDCYVEGVHAVYITAGEMDADLLRRQFYRQFFQASRSPV